LETPPEAVDALTEAVDVPPDPVDTPPEAVDTPPGPVDRAPPPVGFQRREVVAPIAALSRIGKAVRARGSRQVAQDHNARSSISISYCLIDFVRDFIMTKYSVQEAPAKLGEILQKIRGGEQVVLTEDGNDVAEIRPIRRRASTGDPQEDAYWQLVDEGTLVPAEATAEERRAAIDAILEGRFESGGADVAARHDEHQP